LLTKHGLVSSQRIGGAVATTILQSQEKLLLVELKLGTITSEGPQRFTATEPYSFVSVAPWDKAVETLADALDHTLQDVYLCT
jgi:hypothetical protein